MNKIPGPDDITVEFHQTFKEAMNTNHPQIFPKMGEKGTVPNSFHEASIIVIPKSDKDITRKESYGPIFLLNKCKILNKTLGNQTEQHTERTVHHDRLGLTARM